MLFLRKLGIALIACIGFSIVAGTIWAVADVVSDPIRFPTGVLGGVLQIAWLVIAFVILQQLYIRIERWDAIRSGRTSRR